MQLLIYSDTWNTDIDASLSNVLLLLMPVVVKSRSHILLETHQCLVMLSSGDRSEEPGCKDHRGLVGGFLEVYQKYNNPIANSPSSHLCALNITLKY